MFRNSFFHFYSREQRNRFLLLLDYVPNLFPGHFSILNRKINWCYQMDFYPVSAPGSKRIEKYKNRMVIKQALNFQHWRYQSLSLIDFVNCSFTFCGVKWCVEGGASFLNCVSCLSLYSTKLFKCHWCFGIMTPHLEEL